MSCLRGSEDLRSKEGLKVSFGKTIKYKQRSVGLGLKTPSYTYDPSYAHDEWRKSLDPLKASNEARRRAVIWAVDVSIWLDKCTWSNRSACDFSMEFC